MERFITLNVMSDAEGKLALPISNIAYATKIKNSVGDGEKYRTLVSLKSGEKIEIVENSSFVSHDKKDTLDEIMSAMSSENINTTVNTQSYKIHE